MIVLDTHVWLWWVNEDAGVMDLLETERRLLLGLIRHLKAQVEK